MSQYRDAVIVKVGVLIGSLIGIDKCTTLDLDTTVRGFTLTQMAIWQAFEDICTVETDDDLLYSVVRTSDIRETDDYPGIRVHLRADYPPLSMPLTVDVTTGDRIVPAVVRYAYRLSFDDETV